MKEKIGKKEIKVNSRTAPKKSSTNAYIRRTLPDNEILIIGVAPQEGHPHKIIFFGHARTLQPTDDPT